VKAAPSGQVQDDELGGMQRRTRGSRVFDRLAEKGHEVVCLSHPTRHLDQDQTTTGSDIRWIPGCAAGRSKRLARTTRN